MNKNKMTVRQAMNNDEMDFVVFYEAVKEAELGNWDLVNDTDTIKEYVIEQINNGIRVSHILQKIEEKEFHNENDLWEMYLGDALATPTPIYDKIDLARALDIGDEGLSKELIIN